jgi:inosine-uridine nucleoside N-ribohydrolase
MAENDYPVLLDTDAGVDDMLALLLLQYLAPVNEIDVIVTYGNVPVLQGLHNVHLMNLIYGSNIKQIYKGSDAPLKGKAIFATDVHGTDGLGGITLKQDASLSLPDNAKYAGLDQFSFSYRNTISIGPLTDVYKLWSSRKLSGPLTVMGGAIDVVGNISPFAEFNFLSDPEAAAGIFSSYPSSIYVVPLDLCNQIVLSRDYLYHLYSKYKTSVSKFLVDIHQHYMDFYQNKEGINGCHPHDALAIFCAYFKDAVQWRQGQIRVVLDGSKRGESQFVSNEFGHHYVAQSINAAHFFAQLERAFEVCTT